MMRVKLGVERNVLFPAPVALVLALEAAAGAEILV